MFVRPIVSEDGGLLQPMRAGVGLLANFTVTNFNTESDENLTIAQVAGGSINQGLTLTSDVTYTLPTAAAIIAAFDTMDVGDAFSFVVTNTQAAAFDVIIAVNTGITAVGTNNALTVAPQSSRVFTLEKASATAMNLY